MSANSKLSLDSVIEALRTVKEPDSNRDIMACGLIRDLKIESDNVLLKLVLTNPTYPYRGKLENDIKEALKKIAGAASVYLQTEHQQKKEAPNTKKHTIPGVRYLIAVSSGKGGVGKSTVSSNLAVALHQLGYSVGLLDTDIYGPNIPTMMGVQDAPMAKMDEKRGELLEPLMAHGVKLMSMGFLTKGDQPLVWRGPMLHSVVNQFLNKVDWGNLDFLVVDMPPGTGDVQLSLTQLVAVDGAVVVTTPQEVSMQDVRKAILMFEKVNVPILGIVENMSSFVCDGCGKEHSVFGSGGGSLLAEKYHTTLLGQIPLGAEVREAGDNGAPVLVRNPQGTQSKAFLQMAMQVVQKLEKSEKPELTISGF
ncbi:MAG: Mrp/NBP35 family ATP-binding protein [Bacteriovoracia bacterium]